MLKYKIPQIVTLTRSSCSDWLGYTLKRKLTNQENPLTRKSADLKFLFFFFLKTFFYTFFEPENVYR